MQGKESLLSGSHCVSPYVGLDSVMLYLQCLFCLCWFGVKSLFCNAVFCGRSCFAIISLIVIRKREREIQLVALPLVVF